MALEASELYKEGKTALYVPSQSAPKMIPAFFNPMGRFVRDVSIVCYDVYSSKGSFGSRRVKQAELSFADALSGTGARGVRVANEIQSIDRVFLNDVNSRALEFARKSAEANSILDKCVFSKSEVTSFLTTRTLNQTERFDYVDVDPFGSPSDYVDCAIRSVRDKGLLSLTATDSAVLCGVYPRVALRKYLGLSLRTEYCHEVGVRLLLGLAAQTAMRLEAGISPVFCHHDMHYFRAYFSVNVGNPHSRDNENEIGYIVHCFNCGHRRLVSRDDFFGMRRSDNLGRKKNNNDYKGDSGHQQIVMVCENCGRGSEKKGGRISVGGPLWIGKISSREFVSSCKAVSGLSVFADELDLPLYYDLKLLRLKSGTSMPKINHVLEKLIAQGYLASRTRMNPTALRTDATKEALNEIVLELAQ